MNLLVKIESRRSLCLVFCASFLALAGTSCSRSGPGPAPEPGVRKPAAALEKIAEADQLYAGREDLNRVRVARAALRQARIDDDSNYEAAWKLARANYFLGDRTEDDRERSEAFKEGIQVATIATQLRPDGVEGHFWLGANYGGDAEHSTLAGLANVEDIRKQMEKVIQLDEDYGSGSAYLGLGQLYLRAPRVLGGNTDKAIQYLEKGLQFGKDNSILIYNLAEAYYEANREAEARKQIEGLRQMTPHPDFIPEHKKALADAEKLWQKMEQNRR